MTIYSNDYRFENYTPFNFIQQQTLDACLQYKYPDQGLFLQGKPGLGKTHLCYATFEKIKNENPDIRADFFNVTELLVYLQESYSDAASEYKKSRAEEKIFNAKHFEFVVLDDVGAIKATEWVQTQLYSIIDARYRLGKVTFFTSNCSGEELGKSIGMRTVSRIIGMTKIVKLDGKDCRISGVSM